MVVEQTKKFPTSNEFEGSRRVHKSLLLGLILGWWNPVQILRP
jgi:hypothetical protein